MSYLDSTGMHQRDDWTNHQLGRRPLVKFVRTDSLPLDPPQRPGDVGYDLPVVTWWDRMNWCDRTWSWIVGTNGYVVWPGQVRSLPSGIALEMPPGIWARIDARSSSRNRRLDVCGGRVIDTGYRGALVSVIRNIGFRPRFVKAGERVAQIIFERAVLPEIIEVDRLSVSARNTAGFGSTGR